LGSLSWLIYYSDCTSCATFPPEGENTRETIKFSSINKSYFPFS